MEGVRAVLRDLCQLYGDGQTVHVAVGDCQGIRLLGKFTEHGVLVASVIGIVLFALKEFTRSLELSITTMVKARLRMRVQVRTK